jgi:hypothetical protein
MRTENYADGADGRTAAFGISRTDAHRAFAAFFWLATSTLSKSFCILWFSHTVAV